MKKYTQGEINRMRDYEVKKLYEQGKITTEQVIEYLIKSHYYKMAAMFRCGVK